MKNKENRSICFEPKINHTYDIGQEMQNMEDKNPTHLGYCVCVDLEKESE